MELESDYESLCEQYLLGELSESEQAQLEEAYFADDLLFERFLTVKDELLDAYSRGGLTRHRLERFEQHFLSSEARRQKVEETRELIQAVSAAPNKTATAQAESSDQSSSRSGRQWFSRNLSLYPVVFRVGLVVAVVVVVAVGWVVVRQIQDRSARQSEEERARNATKPLDANITNGDAAQVPASSPSPSLGNEKSGLGWSPGPTPRQEIAAKPSPQAPSAQVASLTLLPFSSRDPDSANSLALIPEVRRVRLTLVFNDASYVGFEVVVRTVDGQQVFRRGGLKASSNGRGKSVTITFDSSLLHRQDYIVTLSALMKNGKLETIGDYYFRVLLHAEATTPRE